MSKIKVILAAIAAMMIVSAGTAAIITLTSEGKECPALRNQYNEPNHNVMSCDELHQYDQEVADFIGELDLP